MKSIHKATVRSQHYVKFDFVCMHLAVFCSLVEEICQIRSLTGSRNFAEWRQWAWLPTYVSQTHIIL